MLPSSRSEWMNSKASQFFVLAAIAAISVGVYFTYLAQRAG
jgi:hypothetical protein